MSKIKEADEHAERQLRQLAVADSRERDLQAHVGDLEASTAKLERESHILRERSMRSFRATSDQKAELADFLVQCLEDVKGRIVTVTQAGDSRDGHEADVSVSAGRLDDLSLGQRERAIHYLLENLHSTKWAAALPDLGLGTGRASSGRDAGVPPLSSAPASLPPIGDPRGAGASPSGAAALASAVANSDVRDASGACVSVATQTKYMPVIADMWSSLGPLGMNPGDDGPVGAEVRPWGAKMRTLKSLPQQRRTTGTYLKTGTKGGRDGDRGYYLAGTASIGTEYEL